MITRRFATLAVTLLAIIGATIIVARVPLLADMSAFLPSAPSAEQQLLITNLQRGAGARLLLAAVHGVAPQARRSTSDELVRLWRELPEVASVSNGAQADLDRELDLLFDFRYLLSPTLDASQFVAPALTESLVKARALLATSAGLFNREKILADPTGAALGLLDLLDANQGPQRADGVWIDGEALLFIVNLVANGTDLDAQERAIAAIDRRYQELAARAGLTDSRLVLTGAPRFAVQSREEIRSDVSRLSILGVGLIVALLVVVFRAGSVLVIALIPLMAAVLAGAAAVAVGFGSIHALTLGFGAALIGECVDYALYHLVQTSGEGIATENFWRQIRLGMSTSLVGFGALYWSHFPGLAQLSVFAMAGITAGYLSTRFVLPLITARGLPTQDFTRLEQMLRRTLSRLHALRMPSLLVLGAAALAMLVNGMPIWNSDIAALNPVSREALALDAGMRRSLGGPDINLLVMVQSRTQDTDTLLTAASLAAQRLRATVGPGQLSHVGTVTDFVPPPGVQRARQAMLPDSAQLESLLARIAPAAGLSLRSLQRFAADVESARKRSPIELADYADSNLATALNGQLTSIAGVPTAILSLVPAPGTTLDADDLARTIGVLPNADARVIDVKARTDELYGDYLREAGRLALGGAAAIVLLLAASLRDARRLLAVLLPVSGAVLLIVAGLVLTGNPLTLLHLVGLLLVAAIGSNYALVLASGMPATRSEQAQAIFLTPLLLANLTTLIGFGVMAASKVPLLAALGITVGFGTPLVLLLAAIWADGFRK